MLLNNKNTSVKMESGFSLVEAMVATVIIGVAFAGIYNIALFSSKTLNASSDRQKLQLIADQMMEVIESDIDNIDFYDLDFTTCNAPDSGETEDYHLNRYRWCRMLNSSVNTPATGDTREIAINSTSDGKLVTITLDSRNGETNVVMKRLFSD